MAITFNKWEAYYRIRGLKSLYTPKEKSLIDDTIIRVAKEQYDVNLTKEDIEAMRKHYTDFIMKYRMMI